MTNGTLAMITCPILEDEMIYSILNDPEDKRIYLLRNKNTSTLVPKLEHHNIDYINIDEKDFLKGTVSLSVCSTGFWRKMDCILHNDKKRYIVGVV